MQNPFPGMNPYLEHPELWHQVHNRLIVSIADEIAGTIAPKCRVSIKQRVQLPMSWEVKERYLEIREIITRELVCVVEVLSPVNKRSSKGRSLYEAKRTKILNSMTHLVEIDLLRSGKAMPMTGQTTSHYRILVSRSTVRPNADLFAFNLPEPIPAFPIPLKAEDNEPIVDLQRLLNEMYDRARLDLSIDYSPEAINPSIPMADSIDLDWLLQKIT
jgi:hypothetical protein